MKVLIHPQILRYLAKLAIEAPGDRERCVRAIDMLRDDPRHPRPGADILTWNGPEFDYRLRVRRHRFGYTIKAGSAMIDDAWYK